MKKNLVLLSLLLLLVVTSMVLSAKDEPECPCGMDEEGICLPCPEE